MMSGVSLETCWAIKKNWNNKFYYTVASCRLFLYDLYYDARIHEHRVYIDNYIAQLSMRPRLKRGRMNIVANARSALPLAATFVHVNGLKANFPLNWCGFQVILHSKHNHSPLHDVKIQSVQAFWKLTFDHCENHSKHIYKLCDKRTVYWCHISWYVYLKPGFRRLMKISISKSG